jgi:hypothetical protein
MMQLKFNLNPFENTLFYSTTVVFSPVCVLEPSGNLKKFMDEESPPKVPPINQNIME